MSSRQLCFLLASLLIQVSAKTEAEPIFDNPNDPVAHGAENLGDTLKIALDLIQKLIFFFFLSFKNIVSQFLPDVDSSTMTFVAVGFVAWLWWRNNKRKKHKKQYEDYDD